MQGASNTLMPLLLQDASCCRWLVALSRSCKQEWNDYLYFVQFASTDSLYQLLQETKPWVEHKRIGDSTLMFATDHLFTCYRPQWFFPFLALSSGKHTRNQLKPCSQIVQQLSESQSDRKRLGSIHGNQLTGNSCSTSSLTSALVQAPFT